MAFKTFISFLFICCVSSAQAQNKKIYFDKDWKVTTADKSEFYRIVKWDAGSTKSGYVTDYFKNGKVQMTGYMKDVGNHESESGIQHGEFIWYNENGLPSRKSSFKEGKLHGQTIYYDLLGGKQYEYNYNDGYYHGAVFTFYKNGKVNTRTDYINGRLASPLYIKCNEFGDCEKVFIETFKKNQINKDWNIDSTKEFKTKIFNDRLYLSIKNRSDHINAIHLPLDRNNKFTIEGFVSFITNRNENYAGLTWGYQDRNNYFIFVINPLKQYKVIRIKDGIIHPFFEWQNSTAILGYGQRNLLKIVREGKDLLISINGQLQKKIPYEPFTGNLHGVYVSGNADYYFDDFEVHQFITEAQKKELAL